MKKLTRPSIRAHVLRSAFYLLLPASVFAMSLTLAQQQNVTIAQGGNMLLASTAGPNATPCGHQTRFTTSVALTLRACPLTQPGFMTFLLILGLSVHRRRSDYSSMRLRIGMGKFT